MRSLFSEKIEVRDPAAAYLHWLLLKYINQALRECYRPVGVERSDHKKGIEALEQSLIDELMAADITTMLEPSINGFLFIHDILRLPREFADSVDERRAMTLTHLLFELYCEKISITPSLAQTLVANTAHWKLSTFMHVLRQQDVQLLVMYFAAVLRNYSAGHIDASQIQALFTHTDLCGKTSLDFLRPVAKKDFRYVLIDIIVSLTDTRILTQSQYERLIQHPGLWGIAPLSLFDYVSENYGYIHDRSPFSCVANKDKSPLFKMIEANDFDAIAFYRQRVEARFESNQLNPASYAKLFFNTDNFDNTILYQIASENLPDGFCYMMDWLDEIFEHDIIDARQYATILLYKKPDGTHTLQNALYRKADVSIIERQLKAIRFAFIKKIITKSDLNKYLTTCTKQYTLFHSSITTGSLAHIKAVKQGLRRALNHHVLSKREYWAQLTKPNAAGFTPLAQAVEKGDSDVFKFVLDELVFACKRNFATLDEFKAQIMSTTRRGYNIMHAIAKNAKLEMLEHLVHTMMEHLDEDDMRTSMLTLLTSENVDGVVPNNRKDVIQEVFDELLWTLENEQPLTDYEHPNFTI